MYVTVKSLFSVSALPFPLCPTLAHSRILDIGWHSAQQVEDMHGRHAVTAHFWSESVLTNLVRFKGTVTIFLIKVAFVLY